MRSRNDIEPGRKINYICQNVQSINEKAGKHTILANKESGQFI